MEELHAGPPLAHVLAGWLQAGFQPLSLGEGTCFRAYLPHHSWQPALRLWVPNKRGLCL